MELSIQLNSAPLYFIYNVNEGRISFFEYGIVLANSANPDEMPRFSEFNLALHCLEKYPFKGCQSSKG